MARVKIINPADELLMRSGALRADQIRTLDLDMLVDTGAVMPAVPEEAVEALGLPRIDKRSARLADGTLREFDVVAIALEICGREHWGIAWVLPRGTQALLGQTPLEDLDLVVVPGTGEVKVNPAHPDFPILDLARVA